MRTCAWIWVFWLCCPLAYAQTSPGAAVPQSDATKSNTAASPSLLEHAFFDIIRGGDTAQFLSYLPQDGVNLGGDAQHTSRSDIEEQFTHRTGLYCKLFDSACLRRSGSSDPLACSYRELLTQSDKVRTASTETTRNGVRQAILVAEVHSQKCAGPVLIDFIFNYQQGGWKLFSIP